MIESLIKLNPGEGPVGDQPAADVAAATAAVEAATSANTASTIVKRDSLGYVKDRANSPDHLWPSVREFIARTGITPGGYYRPRLNSSPVKCDLSGANPQFASANTPTYDYAVNGYRGLYIDADGDAVKVAAFEPGLASILYVDAFCVLTDPGAARSLFGKSTTAAERMCYSQLTAADKISVYIEDGTGHGDSNAGGSDQGPISYGTSHIYLFSHLVDRRAAAYPAGNALRTRLSKYGTGVVGAEYTKNITSVTTLTGGTSPTTAVGAMPGIQNGQDVVHLGWLVAQVAGEIEVDGILATVAQALGAE